MANFLGKKGLHLIIISSILIVIIGLFIFFKSTTDNNGQIRITQEVWVSPVKKVDVDTNWDVKAKVGEKTKSPDSEWIMEITSVTSDVVTIKFTGKIYENLKLITKPITLTNSETVILDDGRTGGGKTWKIALFKNK